MYKECHGTPHCFDADPEPDSDPAQNLDADPDPDPGRGGGVGQPKMCNPPGKILGTPLPIVFMMLIPVSDTVLRFYFVTVLHSFFLGEQGKK